MCCKPFFLLLQPFQKNTISSSLRYSLQGSLRYLLLLQLLAPVLLGVVLLQEAFTGVELLRLVGGSLLFKAQLILLLLTVLATALRFPLLSVFTKLLLFHFSS